MVLKIVTIFVIFALVRGNVIDQMQETFSPEKITQLNGSQLSPSTITDWFKDPKFLETLQNMMSKNQTSETSESESSTSVFTDWTKQSNFIQIFQQMFSQNTSSSSTDKTQSSFKPTDMLSAIKFPGFGK